MAGESRLQHLLDEILDSDRTPEEVCGDYPELLPEVRERWRQVLTGHELWIKDRQIRLADAMSILPFALIANQ